MTSTCIFIPTSHFEVKTEQGWTERLKDTLKSVIYNSRKEKKRKTRCYVIFFPVELNSFWLVKMTVRPKMKVLSSFTHLHVFPNQYDFLSSAFFSFLQLDSFCRHSLHCKGRKDIVLDISNCVSRNKGNHRTWNDMRVSKWWQHFHL